MSRIMLNNKIIRSGRAFGRAVSSFWGDTKGNVAMLFGLSIIPIFLVAGFAVDNNRQATYQNKIQNALDFAVLSTAKYALSNSASDEEFREMAQDFFDSQLELADEATLTQVSYSRVGDLVTLTVSGELPTAMMSVGGIKTMPLGTKSAAIFGEPAAAEIALVLDTSTSMAGSKLDTLEDAATSMIDDLIVDGSDAVKMSIVPFATYVNVGTDKEGESWIEVEPEYTSSYEQCSAPAGWYEEQCERETYDCVRDGIESTCSRWDCDDDLIVPKTCEDKTRTHKWYGCVESREAPYNIKAEGFISRPVQGFTTTWSGACPAPMRELTSDADDLTDTIESLSARQNTYIATGLTWGLRTLTPGAPFDGGQDFTAFKDNGGRKALVLMSDGANTKAPSSNGKHNSNDDDLANDNTELVCDEIKSKEIELYTIAFEIDDDDTKELLEDCATSADHYFDASNAAELKEAFEDIGDEFRDIALAY